MTTIPLTEAKARFNELVEEAATTHERLTITRHGRPAVVMMSVEDLEALEETVFWQAEPGAVDDLAAGRAAGPDDRVDEATGTPLRRRQGPMTGRFDPAP